MDYPENYPNIPKTWPVWNEFGKRPEQAKVDLLKRVAEARQAERDSFREPTWHQQAEKEWHDQGVGVEDYTTVVLNRAADTILQRGEDRDTGNERSMSRCVEAFNALTGHEMTVTEGWKFMVMLKLARASHRMYTEDDYVDGAAYMALAAEEHDLENWPYTEGAT